MGEGRAGRDVTVHVVLRYCHCDETVWPQCCRSRIRDVADGDSIFGSHVVMAPMLLVVCYGRHLDRGSIYRADVVVIEVIAAVGGEVKWFRRVDSGVHGQRFGLDSLLLFVYSVDRIEREKRDSWGLSSWWLYNRS